MIKKAVKKDVQLLATSVKHISGMFAFVNKNGEHLLMSNDLKKTVIEDDDLSLLSTKPSDFFNDVAACNNLNKSVGSIFNSGKSSIKYFSGTNSLGYTYSQFNKSAPVIRHNEIIGVFHDVLPVCSKNMPQKNKQDVLLQWINHPDILHQSLLENSAKHKAFHLYGTVIKLSEIEVRCLYFSLMGYDYSEIGVKLKAMNSTINKICTDVLAKFQVKSVAGLMQLLFSGKLLESYGLDQQKVFSAEFMHKIKSLMNVV